MNNDENVQVDLLPVPISSIGEGPTSLPPPCRVFRCTCCRRTKSKEYRPIVAASLCI